MSPNGTNTCGGDVHNMFFLGGERQIVVVFFFAVKKCKKCSFVLEEFLDNSSVSVIPSLG